jgi:RimJ/RimL family protein N-acetyltransferase
VVRCSVEWDVPGLGVLTAVQADPEVLEPHLSWLAGAYNEPFNFEMMGNECLSSKDSVREYYEHGWKNSSLMFLLFLNGELVGDADFRNFFEKGAEFAIAIGARSAQGKGLGTRFGIMLHGFAFENCGLETVLVAILHKNTGSLRLFEKLGYERDVEREFVHRLEDETDVCMFLSKPRFADLFASDVRKLRIQPSR